MMGSRSTSTSKTRRASSSTVGGGGYNVPEKEKTNSDRSWDLEDSSNHFDSSTDDQSSSDESRRDAKKEVYKMSAKDTFRVQLWRFAVTVVLLLTAFTVTWTTYKLLKEEEQSNFEVAVSRFVCFFPSI